MGGGRRTSERAECALWSPSRHGIGTTTSGTARRVHCAPRASVRVPQRSLRSVRNGIGTTTRAGRRERHLRMAAAVLAAAVAFLLVFADTAFGEGVADLPDAQPTAWHEAAGLTPLLTAPPPPNPPPIVINDTGVTPTPDLEITARWAYDGGTLDDVHATPDSAGHGTSVAHFAAGKVNGWGHAGAFPHGRIASVRVFPREGGAKWQDYIRAIARCNKIDPNTKAIVISIGGPHIAQHEADELEHWIERARDELDKNVVVAAGNGGGTPDFPGRFGASFTVAASDASGALCSFSSRGAGVDLAAPGCALVQAGWNGSSWSMQGSSYAAPIVAGTLAALRSYAPRLSARAAEELIVRTARAGASLDGAAALRAAGVELEMPSPRSEQTKAPSPGPTEQTTSAVDVAGPAVGGAAPPSRWPAPEAIGRWVNSRTLLLRVFNRPPRATVEIVGRAIRRRFASGAIRLKAGRLSRLRIRFANKPEASPWTVVPVRPRGRSSVFER